MEVRPRLGEMDLMLFRGMPKSKPLSEVADAGGVSMLVGGARTGGGAQARRARDWNDSMVEVAEVADARECW